MLAHDLWYHFRQEGQDAISSSPSSGSLQIQCSFTFVLFTAFGGWICLAGKGVTPFFHTPQKVRTHKLLVIPEVVKLHNQYMMNMIQICLQVKMQYKAMIHLHRHCNSQTAKHYLPVVCWIVAIAEVCYIGNCKQTTIQPSLLELYPLQLKKNVILLSSCPQHGWGLHLYWQVGLAVGAVVAIFAAVHIHLRDCPSTFSLAEMYPCTFLVSITFLLVDILSVLMTSYIMRCSLA